MSLVKLVRF
uniref:Uncharacterized protein n=1 Tax=Anguilla anguilla TaxID=7936 RepID=A0A0E9SRG6_ANGAN